MYKYYKDSCSYLTQMQHSKPWIRLQRNVNMSSSLLRFSPVTVTQELAVDNIQ